MHDLHIGYRHVWGGEVPLQLSRRDRRRHLYIIGQTATGKSTLLRNLIGQDIAVGSGCALIVFPVRTYRTY
jgi:DNA helicase HerA-like ATPase